MTDPNIQGQLPLATLPTSCNMTLGDLGPGQTSNFTCADSHANEVER